MRSKHFICTFIVFLLLSALLIGCTPSQKASQDIDWQLYGSWFSLDGKPLSSTSFSMQGSLNHQQFDEESSETSHFSIQWPDDFPYANKDSHPYAVLTCSPDTATENTCFTLFGSSYNPVSQKSVPLFIWIFPEKEYAVFEWGDRLGVYLVASTDYNADPAAILELYKQYVRTA